MKLLPFVCILISFVGCQCTEPNKPTVDPPLEPKSDTTEYAVNPSEWVAVDALGRNIDPEGYPAEREDRTVGIFYFIWHGCHGYDTPANSNAVVLPTIKDTHSPFDITKLLAADPTAPAYGSKSVMHHWGEPYLGYYIMNDNWVIRKHAQMLTDAGVDVVFFDATNAYAYLPVVTNICTQYRNLRKNGCGTPQIAFILNSSAANTLATLYNEFYSLGSFKELWFMWEGKPLILCPESAATSATQDFFTFRRSWFSSRDAWFGIGQDKWTWADYWPQNAGWHSSQSEPECISVAPATHPHTNVGRSWNGAQPAEAACRPAEGIHFAKQIDRALEVDPKFVFITGWNEWTAQKQVNGETVNVNSFCGKAVGNGATVFIDQYNEEYSRDLEPQRGALGDNYYYQMTDFIRRYKGVSKPGTYTETCEIKVDGDFDEWNAVKAGYADDLGDTYRRNAVGWGRIGTYTNSTGRNDLVVCKVAAGSQSLSFYVRCNGNISSPDNNWLKLFITVGGSKAPSWEGFNYALNVVAPSNGKSMLSRCEGDWKWADVARVDYALRDREMEVSIPFSALGITDTKNFTIDFKWVDNACADGDIQTCMTDGDSAPDGRFRYRYIHR